MSFFIPLINAVLCAAGLILLFVGIVLAPWQIKLMLLAIGLVLTQQALRKLQSEAPPTSPATGSASTHGLQAPPLTTSAPCETIQAVSTNRFTYRGSDYTPPPVADVIDEKLVTGKYRGTTCQLHIAQPAATSSSLSVDNGQLTVAAKVEQAVSDSSTAKSVSPSEKT